MDELVLTVALDLLGQRDEAREWARRLYGRNAELQARVDSLEKALRHTKEGRDMLFREGQGFAVALDRIANVERNHPYMAPELIRICIHNIALKALGREE